MKADNTGVESHWTQGINPEINKVDGQHVNNADSQVTMRNLHHHTSVLTIALIVIAVLVIIHFLIQFYKSHARYLRRSERDKVTVNLPQPTGVRPIVI